MNQWGLTNERRTNIIVYCDPNVIGLAPAYSPDGVRNAVWRLL
jgi:hypothetical protein